MTKSKRKKPSSNERIRTTSKKTRNHHKRKATAVRKKTTRYGRKRKRKNYKKIMLELTITLIISSILFLLLSFFTFSLPKMEGYSMMTTLEDRDRLFVNKLGAVKRFSLVYYKDPVSGAKSIRRIIGLPFESLYYKNDQLFINDTETVERFIDKQLTTSKNSNSTFTKDFSLNEVLGNLQVPKGKYFVLGDNRSYATDSRTFGYIDEKDIIGVIELRIFPLHRMTHF
ncbi:signal peptidase I [Enterococcus sp. 7F3_DIV0205]|uniref:Signal peptidase I n=1 Tax=Candidatus Enterococcus palustris TaxID=1834189 RepID=A0AAQ3WBI3_9ENTE|nr:signal peptidase I [Enterococcus sp. 7F3_DIV0205]